MSQLSLELGKGEQLTEGNDIAIIATGLMVNEARMAAEQLAAEGIHARVINIHTIKPLDEEIVIKAAKECGKVSLPRSTTVSAVWAKRLRCPERRSCHSRAPRGRAGRVRLLRPRMGPAEEVRSGRSHHLQDCPRDAGQVSAFYSSTNSIFKAAAQNTVRRLLFASITVLHTRTGTK